MSYTPTTWQAGDTITSARLNKMEQGIADGGAGGLVTEGSISGGTATFDKTAGELFDAYLAGSNVVFVVEANGCTFVGSAVYATLDNNGGYEFGIYLDGQLTILPASTSSDYPTMYVS